MNQTTSNLLMELLSATIDRLEGDIAVLRLADGQELEVNLNYLPAGFHEGAVVDLHFTDSEGSEEHRQRQARQLLNQILKSG